jgi:hypothetical protein
MNYRPITDVWILARSKVKYPGAYPAGFLHRARALLGVGPDDAVLHVCAGRVRDYPYEGLGPHDITLDLDPVTDPDLLHDAREALPMRHVRVDTDLASWDDAAPPIFWDAVLIDRPYTREDAAKYGPGEHALPDANALLKSAIAVVKPGHRVGMLDYLWPQPPQNAKEVAVIAVGTGRNNRARWFTVFRRTA